MKAFAGLEIHDIPDITTKRLLLAQSLSKACISANLTPPKIPGAGDRWGSSGHHPGGFCLLRAFTQVLYVCNRLLHYVPLTTVSPVHNGPGICARGTCIDCVAASDITALPSEICFLMDRIRETLLHFPQASLPRTTKELLISTKLVVGGSDR